jgi:GNAT superfamily N-acetyltransferase
MTYLIKKALLSDVADIARIHVLSWQQTYAGLVPQDYLDSLSISSRKQMWEGIFQKQKTTENYLAYDNGEAAGFISFGKGHDQGKEGWGEIYAVYLLKENWGKGIGYALFHKAKVSFLSQGINHIYLWVLASNEQAINSYQKWGGVVDYKQTKDDEIGGQKVREVLVRFDCKK